MSERHWTKLARWVRWPAKRLGRLAGSPQRGLRGERVAASHLKRAGYRVLGRNLRNAVGEVDILALAPDRRTVVVVEVKSGTPTHRDSPRPEVHVNPHKQRKIVAVACRLLRQHRLDHLPVRFDVVGVDLSEDGGPALVRHHVGAFESHL